MMSKRLAQKIVNGIGSYAAFKISSLLKLSFIVGSSAAFFSATSIVLPLVGAFAGSGITCALVALNFLTYFFSTSTFSFHYLAYVIPGLCAALYWRTDSLFLRFLLPSLCMVLFNVHPVGGQAFLYSFYWFIPLVVFVSRTRNLFFHALASTFIAHAVGSVIWLYAVPMTAAAWLGLMPVVAVERLTYGLGFVLAHQAITYGALLIKKSMPWTVPVSQRCR